MPDPQQNQKIDRNTIADSQVQLNQAERDVLSFQNSDQNNVTINNVMATLWAARSQPNLDWDRAKQILEQQQPEIRQRLRDGLIQQQQFEIGLEEQPQQVGRNPLEAVRSLEIIGKESEPLDPSRLIIEAFGREDIDGKLLILGAPGAGKTTMLLSLAEQLVVGALQNPQTTIPIVFELSTWKDDGQSIRDWLVEQLCENFGRSKRKVYGQWLDRGVLLPLLDGLDELGMVRQRKCAEKINEFARHYGRLVVCCRVREYEEAGVRLDGLRGAVCLQALTDGQIERYLNQVRPGMWAAIQESEQMRQLLEPLPEEEVGLLRVPLFVSIAAIVYQPDQPFGGKADLLEKYIDRQLALGKERKGFKNRKWAYKNPKREPDWKNTRHYLKWLATKLKQNNQTELLIEKLQPSWLDTLAQRRQYRLINGLIFGLIAWLTFGLIFGLIGWWVSWWISEKIGRPMFWLVDKSIFGLIDWLINWQIVWLVVVLVVVLITWIIALVNGRGTVLSEWEWSLRSRFDIEPVEGFKIPTPSLMLKKILKIFIRTGKYFPIIVMTAMAIGGVIVKAHVPLLIPNRYGPHHENIEIFLNLSTRLLGRNLFGLSSPWSNGLLTSLVLLFLFLFFWLLGVLNILANELKQDLKIRSTPNKGIWNSFRNMIFTTLVLVVLLSLIPAVAEMTVAKKSLPVGGIFGALMAIHIGIFWGGGVPFIKHFCLRFVLTCNHSAPWDYVSFLNYCAERRLLQRVGGRYRFLHKELLDHFAQDGEVGSQRL